MSKQLTIFFADIANSTSMYEHVGDVEAHRRIAESLKNMQQIIEAHGGELLRTVGDAVLASFPTADGACNASVGMQQNFESQALSVRVGFHAGEVIPDEGDIYGTAVNLAARVASFAEVDEIYTTQDTVEQLSVENQVKASYLDKISFKGIANPMAVCRVNWATASSETKIISVSNRTQLIQSSFVLELSHDGHFYRVDSNVRGVTIGRTTDNDVVIDNESTSRNHARIDYIKGKYILKDSSTNGTYVRTLDGQVSFIRRDQFPLEQPGIIAAGWQPGADDIDGINYRLAQS